MNEAPKNPPNVESCVSKLEEKIVITDAPQPNGCLETMDISKVIEARKDFVLNYVEDIENCEKRESILEFVDKLLPLPKWYKG